MKLSHGGKLTADSVREAIETAYNEGSKRGGHAGESYGDMLKFSDGRHAMTYTLHVDGVRPLTPTPEPDTL